MARRNESVIYIRNEHQFNGGNMKTVDTGPIYFGETFSPFAGLLFQFGVHKLDKETCCIIVKNCGNESVKILRFQVKCPRRYILAKKNEFTISPGGCVAAPCFQIDGIGYLTLTCCMDIDVNTQGIITKHSFRLKLV